MRDIVKRDHRIDVLRGLCLVALTVNHLPNNPLKLLTYHPIGLFNVAAVFFLVAGYGAAPSRNVLRRIPALYLTYLIVSFLGVAILGGVDPATTTAQFPIFDGWTILRIATMTGVMVPYTDILSIYVLLFAATPAILKLARRSSVLLLGASVALWILAQCGVTLTSHYYNPLGVQIVYVAGILLYRHSDAIRAAVSRTPVTLALAAVSIACLAFRYLGNPEHLRDVGVETFGFLFVLNFFAVAALFLLFPKRLTDGLQLRSWEYRWFARLGRNSLYVYGWSAVAAIAVIPAISAWAALPSLFQSWGALAVVFSLAVPATVRERFFA